jgi:DNA-binding XRE family transcriptional regulator
LLSGNIRFWDYPKTTLIATAANPACGPMWKPAPSDYKRFCEKLQRARVRAGLTQAELARRLGCPQSVIAKCENGERRVDVVEFVKIGAAIGFDPASFVRHLATKK